MSLFFLIWTHSIIHFFAATAALRTTRGNPYVRPYARPSLLAFLPFTQKIFRQPIPQNLWSYAIFFCGCPYEKKIQKFSVRGGTGLFGHQVALIKKIFLQTLVEIIVRYHKNFLGFWEPQGPPYEENKKILHVRSWVSKWC